MRLSSLAPARSGVLRSRMTDPLMERVMIFAQTLSGGLMNRYILKTGSFGCGEPYAGWGRYMLRYRMAGAICSGRGL